MSKLVDNALLLLQFLLVVLMAGSWGGALDFSHFPVSTMFLINIFCVVSIAGVAWLRRLVVNE